LDGEFNLPKLEENILNFWKTNRIFEKSLERTKNKKPFTFYDGPPFATGLPHYGHILASTIKDVIPRYQTMKGRFVRRRWGWDCHGLPIEEIVERHLGISGKKQIEKIGIEKFNETCRSKVLEYAGEWKKTVERIARWIDFDNSYKTMDRDYMESVWWAFKQIYDKGLVYEGRKVLLYCPRCETPISNFEVAMDNSYQDITEESVTVKLRIKNKELRIKDREIKEPTYFLAWTTTPWTLPGNVALAVGGDIEYSAVRLRDEKEIYIVASGLASSVFKNKDIEIVHNDIKGKDLVGLEYEPLFSVPAVKSSKAFKVYAADFVTTDEGTGIVHTAVVYGEEDYELGQKVGLPVVPLLDEKGKFNEQAPKLIRGLYFKDSEKVIKTDLEKRGLLFSRENHVHSYPYCWRCNTPLFYNAIPAWFINIQKIKSKLIKSNTREINWFPSHLKHGRYEKSVEAAPDWNISRNRYWGNPIPIWKCEKCGKQEVVGSLDELNKHSSGPKNEYWAMRHGQAETQLLYIHDSGQGKYHLTQTGREQVAKAADKLKKEKINFIASSDLLRTRETVRIAAKILGVKKIIFDRRLRDINLGEFNGKSPKKYHKSIPTYEEKFERGPGGGESLRELRARMWSVLLDLERKYKNKKILIVSHEYPIWMLTHSAEAWDEKQAIEEKEKRGGDFIGTGEIGKINLKIVPRARGGEADLHRPYIDEVVLKCKTRLPDGQECGGKTARITEIFDSWVEAGSMPFAEYHYPFENKKIFESRLPAQFVAEYIAQTRAWFYVMHVISLVLFGKAPFENVVTTGTILAGDGSKMSKSKGNFPDPWEVINKYGVDALRFYLMNSVVMQADNLNFNVKDVEIVNRKVILILWNVYKYFETYAPRQVPSSKFQDSRLNVLDKWIMARTNELVTGVTEYLDKYDTVRATRVIAEYVDDLSTWYLRRSRKRRGPAFFRTLYDCLMTTSKVTAPFMPYLAEILYLNLSKYSKKQNMPESVHLTDWPAYHEVRNMKHETLIKQMEEVRRLTSLALAKRAEAGIKVRQPLKQLKIRNEKLEIKGKPQLLELLKDEVNVKKVVFDTKTKDEVELDTHITPELREEGILRELTRTIQDLRQKAGFKPKDKIVLMVELPQEILPAVSKNEKTLKVEVNAKEIQYKKSAKFNAEIETKIENQNIWVAVKKI